MFKSNGNSLIKNAANSNKNLGIYLDDATENTLTNNNALNNYCGIWMEDDSSNNTMTKNICSNNEWCGIGLGCWSNNKIYLNNLNDNEENVHLHHVESPNIWNSIEKITYLYKSNQYTNYLGNYWGDYTGTDSNKDGIGDIPYNIGGYNDYYPLIKTFENYEIGISDSECRQQLVEAIEDLEQAILDSIDYDIKQVADSYALLAVAAELTPWWRELARLAFDTISAVVGAAVNVVDFLTPEGANHALEDASTSQQILKGVKDSKDILGDVATAQGLVGLYRNADSYKLSFEAISNVEEEARQEYKVSEDFNRASNAAWLALWIPSTTNGLLIPLKTGAPLKEGGRSSVTHWVNGIKEAREEVKNSFDDIIAEIPDPLPADYPLNATITYLNNLKQQIRGGGYRLVKFKGVEDDKEIERYITLGMVHDGREATSDLYDAWMHDLDVQYTSTVHKTGETIMHVTAYGFPATGVTKKVMKGVSDLYEVIDIIHLPPDLVNLIDKSIHPLDALQYHVVKMNNDLVHETSNLWALSDGTLKFLQYTLEAIEDSTPPERLNVDELKAMILASAEEVDTYKFDMDVTMKMLMSNETDETEMTTISNGRGVVDIVDKKMKMNMNTCLEMLDTTEVPRTMEMEMYLVNNTMYMKDLGIPELPAQWTKIEMPEGSEESWESQDQLKQQMELLTISELELLEDEKVNGVDCYVLNIVPDTEKFWETTMAKVMARSTQDLAPGIDLQKILKSMSTKEWIAKDTNFLMKTQMAVHLVVNSEDLDIPDMVEKFTMTADEEIEMRFYDYNTPVSIELPEAAESASGLPLIPMLNQTALNQTYDYNKSVSTEFP